MPPATAITNQEPSDSQGYTLAFDGVTNPSTLYLGGGDKPSAGGYLAANGDPWGPTVSTNNWQQERPPHSDNRVIGVAAGRNTWCNASSSARVLLAASEANTTGPGLYRKVGGAAAGWDPVTLSGSGSRIGTGNPDSRVDIYWPTGSNWVYVYDQSTGLWRSDDCGNTFALAWAGTAPTNYTGTMAGDPTSPHRLYISTEASAYQIPNARQSIPAAPGTNLVKLRPATGEPALDEPGPLAVDCTGAVVVSQVGSAPAGAMLFRAVSQGASQLEVISDAGYAGQAVKPNWVAASPAVGAGCDRTIYVDTDNSGIAVVTP